MKRIPSIQHTHAHAWRGRGRVLTIWLSTPPTPTSPCPPRTCTQGCGGGVHHVINYTSPRIVLISIPDASLTIIIIFSAECLRSSPSLLMCTFLKVFRTGPYCVRLFRAGAKRGERLNGFEVYLLLPRASGVFTEGRLSEWYISPHISVYYYFSYFVTVCLITFYEYSFLF